MFAAACTLTALCAIADWWARWHDRGSLEQVAKPAATIGAILIALSAGGPTAPTVAGVVALVLCLVGDIALLPRFDRFIAGLVAFLAGHIAFGVMFVKAGLSSVPLAGVGLIIVGVIGGVAGAPILRGAGRQRLSTPVAAYLAVISLMTVLGWATGNWLFIVGATAFVISDATLGWGKFVGERRWTGVAVMITYHVAIVGLATGLRLV